MDDGHDLVVRTIQQHAPALLRTARKHSLCPDDAHDAYQRALEIFLKRADTVDAATADRWLHVVVKHEAMAVRKARLELVGAEEATLDTAVADGDDADDRAVRWDRLSRSAEALQRLKPQELTALWLKASGLSYAEIAERQGWTHTKVNRCVTEGRRAFLARYAGIEAGEECRRWAPVVAALVDGEATAEQVAAARPHLRRCPSCRATVRELRLAGPRLGGVLPLLPVAAAGGATGRFDALRLLESAWGAVQERAGLLAVKTQPALEVVSGGKLAAVASAAVVAGGGGALAVHQVRTEPAPRSAAFRAPSAATTRPAATTVALIAPVPARTTPGVRRTAPSGSAGPSGQTTRERPAAEFPRTRAHEFTRTSTTGRSRSTREFRTPTPAAQPPVAAVAPEPVATTARHEFAVPNAPTAGTSSSPPTAAAGSAAVEHPSTGEFGGG